MRTLRDLLIGLFVAFWVGEAAVLLVWGEQPKFPRRVIEAPWGLRYNDPGASYRHKSADVNVRFEINQQGMRADQDYAYEKPDDTLRIISIGDSFAMGYEVEYEETYAQLLEDNLEGMVRPQGLDVDVMNAGVSGFSTAEAILYLERELIKYDPDVVVLGFYYNDFSDNPRTQLFSVDDQGIAQPKAENFVPLGRIGNLLNSNLVFNFMSTYSNAFVLAKERGTFEIKKAMAAAQQGEAKKAAEKELAAPIANIADGTETGRPNFYPVSDYEKTLLLGLLERLYTFCHERDISLVIQVIPTGGMLSEGEAPDRPFVDLFPYDEFDAARPGLAVVPMIDELAPHYRKRVLINPRSHRHWTPFGHQLSGNALAKAISDRGILDAMVARRP